MVFTSNLDFYVLGDKDVPQFEISVDHSVVVHVLDGRNELLEVEHGLLLRDLSPLLDEFHHALVRTHLKQDDDQVLILKESLELYNVLVMQGFVYVNFHLQLHQFCLREGW